MSYEKVKKLEAAAILTATNGAYFAQGDDLIQFGFSPVLATVTEIDQLYQANEAAIEVAVEQEIKDSYAAQKYTLGLAALKRNFKDAGVSIPYDVLQAYNYWAETEGDILDINSGLSNTTQPDGRGIYALTGLTPPALCLDILNTLAGLSWYVKNDTFLVL